MEALSLIIALSVVMWYIIDRFKPMWEGTKYGKYVTTAVSGIFGFGIAFAYGLDLIFALGLVSAVSTTGILLTGASLMGGSSVVAEIVAKIKGGPTTPTV